MPDEMEAETTEVVVHGLLQLGGRPRVRPATLGVAARAHLGDEVQVLRIGRERLPERRVRLGVAPLRHEQPSEVHECRQPHRRPSPRPVPRS